jgi:thioredoxin-related protein
MKHTLLLALLLPLFAIAQQGMKFEHGLTWAQIQAKAKAENKYIFMDAYTTWCGPCIRMAKEIFPLEEVGNFFNDKFINVKVQLDSTDKDNDEVKSWYQDGHDIKVKYKVNAFPTYLFFDPNGKIVHRAVGASAPDKFIAKAQDAFNPDKQYYVLLEQYNQGKKDPSFLRKVAISSQEAYDMVNMRKISKEYLQTQQDYTTADNLDFLNRFTSSSKDTGFSIIMNNTAKYDAVKGKGSANRKIVEIVMQEEVFAKVFAKDAGKPDFTVIGESAIKKYPVYGAEAVANGKVTYYQYKKDWTNFQTAVVDYMKQYGVNATPDQLNSYARAIFDNCKDMTCIKEALAWSKKSFAEKENPLFLNTYANILYRLGKNNEAIKWQEKALATTSNNNKTAYQETLDKMKKGEKTWVEN